MELRQNYHAPAGKSIGEQLRAIRLHRRLSQQSLSDRTGPRQYRVSLLERGMPASPEEIASIASALSVSPETLSDPRVAEAVEAIIGKDERAVAGDGR